MQIIVVDRDGSERTIVGRAGEKLMIVLREHDYEIDAVCGGVCNCGTCHVYVDAEWFARLPKPAADEVDVLAVSAHERPTSRLSCQIVLQDAMDGLRIAIAPVED
jgi:2Fe-2S ferredoxin